MVFRLFWFPYHFVIASLLLVCRLCEWFYFDLGIFRSTFYLYRKSGFTAILWMADFINYHIERKENDIMAKIFALRPGQVQDYILKDQEKDPPESQTIFKIKYLNVSESAQVSDMIYSAKGFGKKREELLRTGTQQLHVLRKGLIGWENFKYEDGTVCEWEDVPTGVSIGKFNTIMDRNLDKLPPEVRDELADEIRGASALDLD